MKIKLTILSLLAALLLMAGLTAVESDAITPIPISVSITGDVSNPGMYNLTALNRVSAVLMMADPASGALPMLPNSITGTSGLTIQKFNAPALKDTSATNVYRQRNVVLIRHGQKQMLDLLRYYRLGDLSQNPYLKDGDELYVTPVKGTVTVEGSVLKPGEYEFKQGDSIKDMLELALGVTPDAALNHVMFYRYKSGNTDFDRTELDLSGYPDQSGPALNKPLQANDRILIPSDAEFRKAYKVTVVGKVKLPGTYYINESTTLFDLMQMCGGPTQEADLRNSFVYNKFVSENYDPDFERLSKYAYTQMTWLEYSYLRTKTRQLKGKYSVNVASCWNSQGKDANLDLRDGDELYVPEILNGVWVAGQVRNPGLVTWSKDLKWRDYISSAGGFANNNKNQGIRIIRVNSGNWIKPSDKISINPGDIIFIPDKEERYTWDYVKESLVILSQLLTILVAIRTF